MKKEVHDITLRELLKVATCDIWITFEDDPNAGYNKFHKPDMILQFRSGEKEPEDVLDDKLLDSPIHLLTACENAVYVSFTDEE